MPHREEEGQAGAGAGDARRERLPPPSGQSGALPCCSIEPASPSAAIQSCASHHADCRLAAPTRHQMYFPARPDAYWLGSRPESTEIWRIPGAAARV
jgi:hypothetical protein